MTLNQSSGTHGLIGKYNNQGICESNNSENPIVSFNYISGPSIGVEASIARGIY